MVIKTGARYIPESTQGWFIWKMAVKSWWWFNNIAFRTSTMAVFLEHALCGVKLFQQMISSKTFRAQKANPGKSPLKGLCVFSIRSI